MAVDVLVVGHGGEHDRRVRVVGDGNDDGIKFIGMLGEGFAVVFAGEGLRVVLGGPVELVGIDILTDSDAIDEAAGRGVTSHPIIDQWREDAEEEEEA